MIRAALKKQRRLMKIFNEKTSLVLLLVLMIITLIRFDRPLVRGDGVAYLAWVDSLALDHDFDLENQAERLAPVNTYHVLLNWHNGKYVNVFPFGVAFFQYPFYRIGHFFFEHGWLNLNPDYFYQMQGVPFPYSFWLMIGANIQALVIVIIAWSIAKRFCHPWLAAFVCWAVFFGTPLFFYSTVAPISSHISGTLCVTLLFYLIIHLLGGFPIWQDEPDHAHLATWGILGISAGLMVLSRWQLLLIAIPIWMLIIYKKRCIGGGVATFMFAISLLPLPLVWNYLFDHYFLVPYDLMSGHPFLSPPVDSLRVLWYTLYNSPILFLSLIGLVRLWRISHEWTLVFGSAILLQILVNGSALDWWAGESFGMRRMTELYFIYAVLAAIALGHLPQTQGLSRITGIALRIFLVALVIYNILFVLSYFVYNWTCLEPAAIWTPKQMIQHFIQKPNRWEIVAAMFRTHLGPPAWPMPGP